MISVYVIDLSADGRKQMVDRLSELATRQRLNSPIFPNLNFKPLSYNELRFNKAPDICILGSELVEYDKIAITNIKKVLPTTPVIACIESNEADLGMVEQLARLGINDLLGPNSTPSEFLQKILLLNKRVAQKSNSELILVDSGKGGLGVTSIVSALGEKLAEADKKVLLIDLDVETQDLCRFLQVRPFVNENLSMMLDENRPVVSDFIEQCYFRVWEDLPNLFCMPPIANQNLNFDDLRAYPRLMLSLLENLDKDFDYIIVDMAGSRGALFDIFYKVADILLVLVGSDPASMYATSQRLKKLKTLCHTQTKIRLIENLKGEKGSYGTLLRDDFSRVANVKPDEWIRIPLNYCKRAKRWPGSSSSMFGQASVPLKNAISKMCLELKLITKEDLSLFESIFLKLAGKLKKNKIRNVAKVKNPLKNKVAILSNKTGELSLIGKPKLIEYGAEKEEENLEIASKENLKAKENNDTLVSLATVN